MTSQPRARPLVSVSSTHFEDIGNVTIATVRLDVHSGDRSIVTPDGTFDICRIETTAFVIAGHIDPWMTTLIGEGHEHHLLSLPDEWVEEGLAPQWVVASTSHHIKMAVARR